MALELEKIDKSYAKSGRRLAVLESVSLVVRPGELVVLKGASGSGKTTLLLIAGAMFPPDQGIVHINGVDVYGLSAGERAALRADKIGFVFQRFHLVPYLTVYQNVLTATLAGPVRSAHSRVRDLLDRFGLADRSDHQPSELSVGECQRVAVARAMLRDPPLILADEPTGNLDPQNTHFVLQTLKELSADRSVLLATHDELAVPYATRTIALRDGATPRVRD